MKKKLITIFLILSTNCMADDIRLASDLWCPYTCEPKSDKPGFMIEIAKMILEEAGHKVSYETTNWARAIEDTRKGKYTAIVGANKEEVPDFITPKIAIAQSDEFFWVESKSGWKYKNINSLLGKKIGVINGYAYSDEVDLEVKKKNPAYVIISGEDALTKMIKMTAAKRLDSFVENLYVLEYALKDFPKFQNNYFVPASISFGGSEDLFVSFPPKNPKSKIYAQLLSDGMAKIRKNGKLKIILDKYGLKDWTK
jgi:polar amino acid transport system substrate-binding protein